MGFFMRVRFVLDSSKLIQLTTEGRRKMSEMMTIYYAQWCMYQAMSAYWRGVMLPPQHEIRSQIRGG